MITYVRGLLQRCSISEKMSQSARHEAGHPPTTHSTTTTILGYL